MTTNPAFPLSPGLWHLDPSHSSISFVARHLVVSKVRGTFSTFDGSVTVAPEPSDSTVTVTIAASSVTTGDSGRDEHLRSADFFDASNHPLWQFTSTEVRVVGTEAVVVGELTIKGVTRPVELDVEFEGTATDPWGNEKASFSARAEVNRKDFGLEWNAALEAGGVLVGEKVKIELDVQLVRDVGSRP